MPRRRKIDFWTDALPLEMEWALGFVFLAVWAVATVAYYWRVLGEIDQLLAAFAPLGIKPDESAFRPLLDMASRLAPFIGLPIAFAAWRWTRAALLRALSRAF
jgi:hypothetical protein